jgi:hypothetical protein
MADPADGYTAWLQLEWDASVTMREIQLVFDTGLHRHLTLSHHDGYTGRMHWGHPQPETVRDYSIEIRDGDSWETIIDVAGNFQRCRRHRLSVDHRATAMRIRVTESNGLDHARIAEVRVRSDDSIW